MLEDRAGKLADVLEIERELARVREEIESMEGATAVLKGSNESRDDYDLVPRRERVCTAQAADICFSRCDVVERVHHVASESRRRSIAWSDRNHSMARCVGHSTLDHSGTLETMASKTSATCGKLNLNLVERSPRCTRRSPSSIWHPMRLLGCRVFVYRKMAIVDFQV